MKQTWRKQHVRLYRGSKTIDRSHTSSVENIDQYDGSQNSSTWTNTPNLPDNAQEIYGIAYNNYELSKEQNY